MLSEWRSDLSKRARVIPDARVSTVPMVCSVNDSVANLPKGEFAVEKPAVEYDTAADSGAGCDVYHVLSSPSRAKSVLPQGAEVSVVGNEHFKAQGLS